MSPNSNSKTFTLKEVLSLPKPTEDFLCSDLGYKSFQFVAFEVKTVDDDQVIFSIRRPDDIPISFEHTEGEGRKQEYTFPLTFLTSKQIQTSLTFAVGPNDINNLRMIERHYFKDRLLRSYDFSFGFCIPNTTNNWETLYEIPPLDEKTRKEMIAQPGLTCSDTFYFIDEKLVLHNKATYSFSD